MPRITWQSTSNSAKAISKENFAFSVSISLPTERTLLWDKKKSWQVQRAPPANCLPCRGTLWGPKKAAVSMSHLSIPSSWISLLQQRPTSFGLPINRHRCLKASSRFDIRGEGIYSPPRNLRTSDWVRPTTVSSR